MAYDYYVRTKQGEFRDDRHHFTTKWKGVAAGEISSVHIENPNLDVLTAEEYTNRGKAKGMVPEEGPEG